MWYYARNGQQYGPISEQELRQRITAGEVYANDLVWRDGMGDWVLAAVCPDLAGAFPPGTAVPPPPPGSADSKRIVAGIFALLLGSFGVHKFYLGMPMAGIIMLLGTVATCGIGAMVTHVVGIIEGVIYLSKSDADFYQTYVVEKRSWF